MDGVVAVGVVFEEGEVSGMEADDDVNGSVLEVVVVVIFGLRVLCHKKRTINLHVSERGPQAVAQDPRGPHQRSRSRRTHTSRDTCIKIPWHIASKGLLCFTCSMKTTCSSVFYLYVVCVVHTYIHECHMYVHTC